MESGTAPTGNEPAAPPVLAAYCDTTPQNEVAGSSGLTLAHPGFWMAVVLCMMVVGIQIVMATPLGLVDVAMEQFFKRPPLRLASHPLSVALINIVAFGATTWVALLQNRVRFSRALRLGKVSAGQIGAVLLVLLGMCGAVSEADNLMRWILPVPKWLQQMFKELFFPEGKFFSQMFLLVIIAPVTEELLFRGVILRGLLNRHKPAVAIVLTAILFGIVHLNPWQFVSATLLGIVFGWLYLRTGSIGLCMIAHAMANGLSVFFSTLPIDIPGLTGQPDPNVAQFQPWWVDVLAVCLLAIGVILFRRCSSMPKLRASEVPPVIRAV